MTPTAGVAPSIAASEGARESGDRSIGRVDLARETSIRFGPLEIDPRRRRIARDDGREAIVEPRVMQVLVALARSAGQILSRDEISEACWHGVIVGEDSLNRAVGKLRRLAADIGAGVFDIETVTKVGYRLVVASAARDSRVETIFAPGERQPLALPAKPSIAVLPFKNLSGEADKDYLADAISEDIVTALSRWRWFFVIARHSSFNYRNPEIDPVRVGRELGVRYLLAGGVRTSGQRVRVTVQLIDARNGSNIWADKFDYPLVDVFALQDEVTERVAASIEPAMLHGEAAHIERKSPADFSALDCFYRGMWCFNQVTGAAHDEALSLFREAARLDPNMALGHVGISRTLYGRMLQGESENAQSDLDAALAAARVAIRLDPREATAHFAAAGARLYLGEHAAALDDARLALTLNPNFAYAHYRLGQVLIFAGQPAESIVPIERAVSLSPCDPQLWLVLETLALAHYQNRDYARAVEFARGAERIGGTAVSAVLVSALARLGRLEEAALAVSRIDASGPARRRTVAAPYADPAHREHIREGFRLGREAFARGVSRQ